MLVGTFKKLIGILILMSPAIILTDIWYLTLLAIAFVIVIPLNAFAFSTVYHKLFSHRAFKPKAWVPYLGTFIASLLFLPSPKTFASLHRLHHKYADTDLDPHTPLHGKLYTFFHIFVKPSEKKKPISPELREAVIKDFGIDYPILNKFNDHLAFLAFLLFNVCMFMISADAFVLSIFVAFVNMILHGFANTYQHRVNQDNTVTIVNMPWLTMLISPEFNHATHHDKASNYDFTNEDAKDWMAPIIRKYLSR